MKLTDKKTLVVTNTNVTAKQAGKFGITSGSLEAAGLIEVTSKEEVEEPGRYFVELETEEGLRSYAGYTASWHSPQGAFNGLTEDEQAACFWDGFKRKMVNSPDAVSFKIQVGIVEESPAQARHKAEVLAKADQAYARAIEAGVPEDIAKKIAYNL